MALPEKPVPPQYKRKHGDSGLAGHNYEVNLCTYLLLEATRRMETTVGTDEHIDEFYIASNMALADCLDDIVFKFSYRNCNGQKHDSVSFIQTKHKDPKEGNKRNLTLQKLCALGSGNSKDSILSVLQKFHKAFRDFKETMKNNTINKGDVMNDPIFSSQIDDVNIVMFTNAPLSGKKTKKSSDKQVNKDKERMENNNNPPLGFEIHENNVRDFLHFKNKIYYKLSASAECKPGNQMNSVNIMEHLNDKKECEEFVDKLYNALNPVEDNETTKNHKKILIRYQRPLLDEMIEITDQGTGKIKKEFAFDGKYNMSPLEEHFKNKIKMKHGEFKLHEIEFKLPNDFDQIEENGMGELTLPYSQKYFEEFLNIVEIYVDQPNEHDIKESIVSNIKKMYAKSTKEAEDISVILTEKVRDWWQDKSDYVGYIDKNNSFIKDSFKFIIHFNVMRPLSQFTGRTKNLENFHNILTSDPANRSAVVYGLGGIGKTQFLRKYIRKYFSDHHAIWINAEDENKIRESYITLIEEKLSFLKNDDSNNSNDSMIESVFQYFSDKKCIFVFDNADDSEIFNKVLLGVKKFDEWEPYIVITSRVKQLHTNLMPFPLYGLELTEAIEFIKSGLNIKNDEEDENVANLAETLERYPLLMQQAVSYIDYQRFSEVYSIKIYLAEFNSDKAKMLDFNFNNIFDNYPSTTFKTLAITIDKIASHPEYGKIAIYIFNVMAFCGSDDIHSDMFHTLPDITEQDVKEGVSLLVNYSMVNTNDGDEERLLSVHRLVQDVNRIKLRHQDGEELKILDSALEMLINKISKQTLDHALVVWKYASKYQVLIEKYGSILKDIVDMLYKESRFEEAEKFYTLSKETLLQYFSADDQFIIDVDIEACKVYLRLNKYDLMSALIEDISLRSSTNRKIILQVESLRGTMLLQQSKYDEAFKLLDELLPEATQLLGPGHSATMRIKVGIVSFYKKKGSYREAMKLSKDILDTLQNNEPFDIRSVLDAKTTVALSHRYLGEYDDALIIFNEILEIEKEMYGENTAITLRTMNNISVIYSKQGKYEEALKILRESLKIKMTLYSDVCSSILTTKHNIAAIYIYLPPDEHEEGLALLEEVVEQKIKFHGISHNSTLNSLKKFGLMLCMRGEYEKAMKINQRGLSETQKLYMNEKHPHALDFYTNIARIHLAYGRKSKALKIVERILDVKVNSKDFGEDHPETLEVAFLRASILGDMGKIDKAMNVMYQVKAKTKSQLGPNHLSFTVVQRRLRELRDIKSSSVSTRSFIICAIKQIAALLFVFVLYNVSLEYNHKYDMHEMLLSVITRNAK